MVDRQQINTVPTLCIAYKKLHTFLFCGLWHAAGWWRLPDGVCHLWSRDVFRRRLK